jgi:hypothetical protein
VEINWPDATKPEYTPVHARDQFLMPGVELERVWEWLCRPNFWLTWYSNSSGVHLKNQTYLDLRLGTEFRWRTFGVTIDSTVPESVEHERLAWDAHCNWVHAYRAWAFEQRDGGLYRARPFRRWQQLRPPSAGQSRKPR